MEEPPKESLQEVVFDEDMVNEYAAVPASGSTANLWSNLRQITTNDNSEQPSSPRESDQSTTTIQAAKPISPVSREKEEKGGEASTSTSSTTEAMDDKSSTTAANAASLMDDDDGFEDNTPESSSNSPERGDAEDKKPPLEGVGQFPLSRKRSSSMRDSMEGSSGEGGGGGGGEREEDVRGTVLQEADSTTLGGEHDDNGRDEGMEGGRAAEAGERGQSQEEEEADRDLEQSTPKKRRSKSPEIETKSSSLEGGRIDNLNIMDTKVAVSDTVVVGGEVEKMESSQDVLESEGDLSLKKRLQPGSVESEEGGGGREREEVAAITELHSSSSDEGEVRETSTGQLERSHDSKTDCKY